MSEDIQEEEDIAKRIKIRIERDKQRYKRWKLVRDIIFCLKVIVEEKADK